MMNAMPPALSSSFFGFLGIMAIVAIVLAVLTAFIHVVLAINVWHDAVRQNADNGRGTFLVNETLRALIVLVSGLLGLTAYWLIHHSALRPRA